MALAQLRFIPLYRRLSFAIIGVRTVLLAVRGQLLPAPSGQPGRPVGSLTRSQP